MSDSIRDKQLKSARNYGRQQGYTIGSGAGVLTGLLFMAFMLGKCNRAEEESRNAQKQRFYKLLQSKEAITDITPRTVNVDGKIVHQDKVETFYKISADELRQAGLWVPPTKTDSIFDTITPAVK